jgi:hypothetical protein
LANIASVRKDGSGQQTLEISDKFKAEVISDTRLQVSPDGNPLVIAYEKL